MRLQLIDLANNKVKAFSHGWFVVRNRTPVETERGAGPVERFQNEQEFFSSQPWKNWNKSLEQERCGTSALKRCLAELLCKRLNATFPTILKEISRLQQFTKPELASLGQARTAAKEKISYLTGIAAGFQDLASQGLRGRYDSLEANDMKLRIDE